MKINKNNIMTLAVAAVLTLAACTAEDGGRPADTDRVPVTIGPLAVAGVNETNTRADGLSAFYAGDELQTVFTDGTNSDLVGPFVYTAHGTWEPPTGGFLVSDIDLDGNPPTGVEIYKGTAAAEDQSTWQKYHDSDMLYGEGAFDPATGVVSNAEGTTLDHTTTDVVIVLKKTDAGWADEDWEHHIRTAQVVIHARDKTSDPIAEFDYTPWLSKVTDKEATFRAHIIPFFVVEPGEGPIISITPAGETKPLTGTYTMAGTDEHNRTGLNQRLTITFAYAPRHLTGTATVEPWQSVGPPETIEHYTGYDMVIKDEAGLRTFREAAKTNPALKAIQTADIVLTETNWEPIANGFSGTYNGGGYTITGLTITSADHNRGLFGIAPGATLTDIHLREVNVSGGNNVGALVGNAGTGTRISNCSVVGGTVTGGQSVGGLVGYMMGSPTVVATYTAVTVTANTSGGGGLVGYNINGTIAFCHAGGDVTGGNTLGGLVGDNMGAIVSCYATGAIISAGSNRGALVGYYNLSAITYSHAVVKGNATGFTGQGTPDMSTNSTDAGKAGETVRNAPGTEEYLGLTAADVWSTGDEPTIMKP